MLLKQLHRPLGRRYLADPVGDFHLIVVKLEGRIVSYSRPTVDHYRRAIIVPNDHMSVEAHVYLPTGFFQVPLYVCSIHFLHSYPPVLSENFLCNGPCSFSIRCFTTVHEKATP